MRILSDHHVHTEYSRNGHGKGTIRETVQAARSLGLRRIIITDHGPGHITYGVLREKFPEIRKEIDSLNEEFEDIEVWMGVEANVLDTKGRIDLREEDFKFFDWVGLGYHNGIIPRDLKLLVVFYFLRPFSKVFPTLKKFLKKIATKALIKAVNIYKIDVITHPGDKIDINLKDLALACKEQGTALEINESHKRLRPEEIKSILDTGVSFSIGSDAHWPKGIGYFTYAEEVIRDLGINKDRLKNICS